LLFLFLAERSGWLSPGYTIQTLMGHERPEDIAVYLQLSRHYLHAAVNPVEQIALPAVQEDQKR
jgi:hypothetical protein